MIGVASRGTTPVVPGGSASLTGSVSSAVRTYFVVTLLPPPLAVSVPAQPAWAAEQVSDGAVAPLRSAAIVPRGSVSAAGAAACWAGVSEAEAGLAKSTPVGALEDFGSKQLSNSTTGLGSSRPRVSVIVGCPTNFDGPPAV